MKKNGIFLNYQMVEAITALDGVDFNDPNSRMKAKLMLDDLKAKWRTDTLPGTQIVVGDKMVGMQQVTLEDVQQMSFKAKNADTYTVENAGALQYTLIKKENGEYDFDFSKLDIIARYAEKNEKKIIIDSAVVFGDVYPSNLESFDDKILLNLITKYTQKLTSRYGKIIERIDVLNAVFQRKKITPGLDSEGFWKSRLGDNYAQRVISQVSESITSKEDGIKLGWNEFYLTNSKHEQRKKDFLATVSTIDELDVIGVQDRFVSSENPEYVTSSLGEISSVGKNSKKEVCVTEFSCAASGSDLSSGDSEQIENNIQRMNNAVSDYCSNDSNVTRVEKRVSKKFDYNYQILKEHGYDVDTTSVATNSDKKVSSDDVLKASDYDKKESRAVDVNLSSNQQSYSDSHEAKSDEKKTDSSNSVKSFHKRSESEEHIYQQIKQKNNVIKQHKEQQKSLEKPKVLTKTMPNNNVNTNSGFTNFILISLIIICLCAFMLMMVFMIVGR